MTRTLKIAHINRRHCVGLALAGCAPALWAQALWPDKPIRMVIPFTAGGPLDTLGRTLAARMGPLLGQSVIIDNRSGAATVIGTDSVAKAPADGYSLLLAGAGGRTILPAITSLPYDPAKDLVPVSRVAVAPQIFLVNSKLGVKSLRELVAYGKANPGKLNMGSVGAGTITSLVGELFKRDAGIKVVDVPYRGGAPALSALIAGSIDVLVADVAAAIPLIGADAKAKPGDAVAITNDFAAKRIVGLAVTGRQRVAQLPSVRTVVEEGYANLVALNVYGLFAPAQTPRKTLQLIQAAAAKALAEPGLREQFARAGVLASSSTPEEFEKFLSDETAKWTPLARALGIKLS